MTRWIPAFAGMTLGLLLETMRKLRLLIAGGIALLLAQIGATTAQDIACSAPLKEMLEIDLMFGRISAARWG